VNTKQFCLPFILDVFLFSYEVMNKKKWLALFRAIYVRCRASTVLCCYDTLCWLLSVTAGTTRRQRGTHIYFRDFPQEHKNNGLDVISSSDTGYCKKWDISDATGHSCNIKCATPFDLRGQNLNLQKLIAYCVLRASNYENNERRGNVSVYDVTLFSTSGQREVAWWDLVTQ